MAIKPYPKCPNCEHDIYSHTFSEDFQGCDEVKCGCSLNLGDYIAALTTRLQEAEAVIKPFANEDFCVELSGNFQGDLSPVFQRVQAMLTLGDFRRAAAWLKGGTE